MEADREFTWTKVPGGYRVVVEDCSGAVVNFDGTEVVYDGATITVPLDSSGSLAALLLHRPKSVWT